jgi:hypothetical protein
VGNELQRVYAVGFVEPGIHSGSREVDVHVAQARNEETPGPIDNICVLGHTDLYRRPNRSDPLSRNDDRLIQPLTFSVQRHNRNVNKCECLSTKDVSHAQAENRCDPHASANVYTLKACIHGAVNDSNRNGLVGESVVARLTQRAFRVQ